MVRTLFHTLLGVTLALCVAGCTSPESIVEPSQPEGFAVYIAAEQTSADICLEDLQLLQPALLSASDITSYSWANHCIAYPDSVWKRLCAWGELLHRTFVVCVGEERVYWGMFMDDLDSFACQNPVIMLLPRHPDGRDTVPRSLCIERGYPEYLGTDPNPRVDPRIRKALEDAGLLAE